MSVYEQGENTTVLVTGAENGSSEDVQPLLFVLSMKLWSFLLRVNNYWVGHPKNSYLLVFMLSCIAGQITI